MPSASTRHKIYIYCKGLLLWSGSLFGVLLCLFMPVQAHELWLAPLAYSAETEQPVTADIRVGQNFTGDSLMYMPADTQRLALLSADGDIAIGARIGDRPAIQTQPITEGQNIIIYQSRPDKVVYRNFEDFQKFIREKGADQMLDFHHAQNWPLSDFAEIYTRYAKTIVIRGNTAKGIADRQTGMKLEFVLENDLQEARNTGLAKLRLFYQDTALEQAQVTVFSKDEQQHVIKTKYITDAQGRFDLKTQSGHEYLIDHVLIKPALPGQNKDKVKWESLWASITFAMP